MRARVHEQCMACRGGRAALTAGNQDQHKRGVKEVIGLHIKLQCQTETPEQYYHHHRLESNDDAVVVETVYLRKEMIMHDDDNGNTLTSTVVSVKTTSWTHMGMPTRSLTGMNS